MQVTPDSERTMRTCLSAARELKTVDLPGGWESGCALMHAEGYCLYKGDLLRDAMRAARAQGAQVGLVDEEFGCVPVSVD